MLQNSGILNTPLDHSYDDLVALAIHVCRMPIAAISLTDDSRQWLKSAHGLDFTEMARAHSFTAHAILEQDLFEVPDALADPRFAKLDIVTKSPFARFYAGAPILSKEGLAYGSVCVLDTKPGQLTTDQRDMLKHIANQAACQIELHREIREREQLLARIDASETRLRRAQKLAGVGDWMFELKTMTMSWSAQMYEIFGFNPIYGPPTLNQILSRYHREDVHEAEKAMKLSAQTGAPLDFDVRIVLPDGTLRWIHELGRVEFNDAGKPYRLVGATTDITERKKAAEEKAWMASIIDSCSDAVISVDGNGVVVSWNKAAETMTGFLANEMIGRSAAWLLLEHSSVTLQDLIDPVINDGESSKVVAKRRRRDGSWFDASASVSPICDSTGLITGVAAVVRDITNIKEAEAKLQSYAVQLEQQRDALSAANEKLEALATLDGLTGLKNHRCMQQSLQEEYHRHQRYGAPLSILMLDVDSFKTFNDAFGHPAGDDVLRAIADILTAACRDTDIVARYGGEEFLVILPNTELEGAVQHAERIRAEIENAAWTKRPITVSIGGCHAHRHLSASSLLECADEALYRSKLNGRNRVTCGCEALLDLAA
ncbi:MAG: diguanylate cyclase [Capsulimonadaceae bacterium]|nr:diguanylate cyclase [Capsulimonadaceae bacterium]